MTLLEAALPLQPSQRLWLDFTRAEIVMADREEYSDLIFVFDNGGV